jgi:hypothetical protein
VQDILRLHGGLAFHTLVDDVDDDLALHKADHGHGLVTLAAPTRALDDRRLLGISGFRLAEYLRAGLASERVVYERSLFCEPAHAIHPDDVHVITVDRTTGKILGYVALAHTRQAGPTTMAHPERVLFPCEEAHGMRLDTLAPRLSGVPVHRVREIKRLVRAHSLTDRIRQMRVTLELLAGIAGCVRSMPEPPQLFVGDVEQHVALRHLVLLGLDVVLLEGTTPRLPHSNVMYPMYLAREKVLPFYAEIPQRDEVLRRTALIEQAAAHPSPMRGVRDLMARLSGTVVTAAAGEERRAS